MTSFVNDLKTDLRDVFLSTQFEIKKYIKQKRLLMAVLIALLLPILFYMVPLATGGEFASTGDAFASTSLSFITILIILSGAIFAGDAVSGEQEKRTGLLLYTTPQRRNSISIGKYLVALIATYFAVSLFYSVIAIEIIVIYGTVGISLNLFKSFLIALLYSASVVSIIYFFSSSLKRSIISTLLGFFSLFLIFPIVTRVLSLAQIDPWFIVTHSADLIVNVLGVSGGGFGPGAEFGIASFAPEFYLGVTVMTVYAVIFFLVGIVCANRQQMEG